MTLRTLGGLELVGGDFQQAKLLLLSAYLHLQGPQPRRYVAELFWPGAADPLNSLSVALRKLRPLGLAQADSGRVWSSAQTDAEVLREHLHSGRLAEGVALYSGEFAHGLTLDEAGEELEEWLYTTRETLAAGVRAALLTLAEREAAAGNFRDAAARAETAAHLPGAAPPEPADLSRLLRLLRAAEHPLADTLAREAADLKLSAVPTPEAARRRLRRTLLGRQPELDTLAALGSGEWAWLRAAAGMGKTALLRGLQDQGWVYLPARSGGLPYATLEPLLGPPTGGEEAVLRQLLTQPHDLCFDDWQALDADTQHLLRRLHAAHPPYRVVIATTGKPPFQAEQSLSLGPLRAPDLQDHPGLFEATGGIPALVDAWMQGQPLETALETRLERLPEADRRLLGALALLDTPDLPLVRAALELSAADLAASLERLLAAGLIDPAGQVRARPAALAHLDTQPALAAHLALRLARQLGPHLAAQPLYQRSRALWDDTDLPAVRRAYHTWGAELLSRGYALKAAETLAEAPPSPELTLLRARALDRAGRNLELLDLIGASQEPELLVLRATVLFRLGQPEEAKAILAAVRVPSLEGQAERHTTLGKIGLAEKTFDKAEKEFKRAANKWLGAGNHERWVVALTNQAVARSMGGNHDEDTFKEALEAAGENPAQKSLVLLNQAYGISRQEKYGEAVIIGEEALNLALNAGAEETAAAALYNLATFYEHADQPVKARKSYLECLKIAQGIKDYRLIGLSLVGLAVLDKDITAGKEGVERLREGGFMRSAEKIELFLSQFRASSGE